MKAKGKQLAILQTDWRCSKWICLLIERKRDDIKKVSPLSRMETKTDTETGR